MAKRDVLVDLQLEPRTDTRTFVLRAGKVVGIIDRDGSAYQSFGIPGCQPLPAHDKMALAVLEVAAHSLGETNA